MAKKVDFNARMDEIFEPWEWHLFQKLKEADEISYRISKEATMVNVPEELRQEYMAKKILDMIDQIAEQREAKSRVRKKKVTTEKQTEAAV